ncbi:hypothetical protein CEXT_302621 [Caerostris extrusa]|uniref:Uncharacterized protein n=1 Tax=Caerostris extrusa TaxID=172846 RepID=A0AAV4VEB1_CAEEX|nr:hypothetical protein CEXT_302621 [Caerostris extrusa]
MKTICSTTVSQITVRSHLEDNPSQEVLCMLQFLRFNCQKRLPVASAQDASVSTRGVRLRIEQRNWSRTGNGGKNFCPLTKIFKKKKKKVGPQVSRPRLKTNNRMQHAPESPPIARLLVVNLLKNLVLPLLVALIVHNS